MIEGMVMSKRKFFDSGEEWQKFRELQAERFCMKPGEYATFFKSYPYSVRGRDSQQGYGMLLTGRPEIAAFMGITVRTLETWRKNIKYSDLPINWGLPASYVITDFLLLWKIHSEVFKMPEGLKRTAIAYLTGNSIEKLRDFIPVTKRTYYKKHYSEREILDAAYLLESRLRLESHIKEIITEMNKK